MLRLDNKFSISNENVECRVIALSMIMHYLAQNYIFYDTKILFMPFKV